MSMVMSGDLQSWFVLFVFVLGVATAAYMRGWFLLRGIRHGDAAVWRALSFLAGGSLSLVVFASAVANVDHRWLTAHMLQHLVLMTIAAPLILAAEPGIMLHHCVSRWYPVASLTHANMVRPLVPLFNHPIFCGVVSTGCILTWHIPIIFALCMRSNGLHIFELGTFFAAGIIFWCPVIQPWPAAIKRERWLIPIYLFLATIPCDALSAFLTFCGRVVYPAYVPTPGHLQSALADQELAGAMMWVWVTFAYLVPSVAAAMIILGSPVSGHQKTCSF